MKKQKIPCIILSVWLSFALLFQIFGVALPAHAEIPDIIPYADYLQSYDEQLKEISQGDGALSNILNDSNIDDSVKYQNLMGYALFTFNYRFAYETLQHMINGDEIVIPSDSIVYKGSGASGVYRSGIDNSYHGLCVFNPAFGVFLASDELNVSITCSDPDSSFSDTSFVQRDFANFNAFVFGSTLTHNLSEGDILLNWESNGVLITDGQRSISSGTLIFNPHYFAISSSNNSIPVLSNSNISNYFYHTLVNAPTDYQLGSITPICGSCNEVTLPTATVPIMQPWQYYNDVLMPYVQQNYPLCDPSIYPFPYGYTPSTPDPTEPLTAPNGGLTINNNWNIGINVIYPTDSSGQPVTNASGETVTETEYVTETYPPDGEYNFQIPTLERLRVYDATLPEINLTAFTDGFNFIWTATENIFTRSGFMPVVMACLGLGVVCYIIWKVGG